MNQPLPVLYMSACLYRSILCVAVLVSTISQALGQEGSGRDTPRTGANARAGKVSGVVVDANTNVPVEYATIALLSRADSALVTGTVTDAKGAFVMEQIPAGAYRMRISFIGYRNAVKDNLVLLPNAAEVQLGTIKIRPSAQNLQEVVVTAEKPLFEQSIDKRVFNVEKSIVAEGGSATDILETIPSVSVDVEGNINLRGSGNVTILIDGKPSGLTGADRAAVLEQIPASAIESIEVVTNPSARYDAEGMSGIINVVLKKSKLQGFNVTGTLSAGTRDKYNASVNLNYRTPKFNAYTNYGYRYNTRFSRGFTLRELTEGGTSSFRQQNADGFEIDNNHLIRAGIDYYLSPRSTLGLSGVYRANQEKGDETTINQNFTGNRVITQLFDQINDTREDGDNVDMNLDYKKTFTRPGQELSGSIRYSYDSDDDSDLLITRFYDNDYTSSDLLDSRRYNIEDINNHVITSQLDYIMPLPKERKIEAGYKSIIRRIDNDFLFQNYQYDAGVFVDNPQLSNRFLFNEQVHSLYGSVGGKIKKFGYQTGLRVEQTFSDSEQKTTDQNYQNNYLNFFPSVFLSYQLKDEQQLQFNYSRRINRPNVRELNPFINYADSLNPRTGNPRLNPELTHALEASYQWNWKSLYVTSSVFYRITNNIIQRIIEVDTNNISYTTFQNLDNRNALGVELIVRGLLTRWWNITSSFNLFRSAISGRNMGANYTNENISWTLSLLSNMNIPKIMQVQVAANYRGPIATAQGIVRDIYGVNIGLKRDILRDRGSLSVNVSDVFDTREFKLITSGPTFSQTRNRKRESRIGTLTFTYRFGNLQEANRRNRQNQENGAASSPQPSDEDLF